jgi:hypothetical protein
VPAGAGAAAPGSAGSLAGTASGGDTDGWVNEP